MSLWDRILDTINIGGASSSSDNYITSLRRDADSYAFVDVGVKNHKIQDIGALRHDGATFHRNSKADLLNFLSDIDFLCGHNIVHHDAKFLFGENIQQWALVDTLYMSPLLFPERPYHRLVKDDKLMSDEMNNPVNDCEKARELLFDEIARWRGLAERRQRIYASLLADIDEFNGFMQMVGAETAILGTSGRALRLGCCLIFPRWSMSYVSFATRAVLWGASTVTGNLTPAIT